MMVTFDQQLGSFLFESRAKIHAQKRSDVPFSSLINMMKFVQNKERKGGKERGETTKNHLLFFSCPTSNISPPPTTTVGHH
jgi:hypothetical protein